MATTNDGWPQFIKTCDDWRERKAKEDGDKGYSGGGMEVLTGLGDCDDLLAAAPRVRANDGRGVTAPRERHTMRRVLPPRTRGRRRAAESQLRSEAFGIVLPLVWERHTRPLEGTQGPPPLSRRNLLPGVRMRGRVHRRRGIGGYRVAGVPPPDREPTRGIGIPLSSDHSLHRIGLCTRASRRLSLACR